MLQTQGQDSYGVPWRHGDYGGYEGEGDYEEGEEEGDDAIYEGSDPLTTNTFIKRLCDMFQNPDLSPRLVSWSGDVITFQSKESLEREVLPYYFKHGRFRSFTRQLNSYNFVKVAFSAGHGPCSAAALSEGSVAVPRRCFCDVAAAPPPPPLF